MWTPGHTRRLAGFTLVELLIAAVVTTFLVAAMADGMGLLGREVEAVRADSSGGPEEAVALMTDMARYGWSVEQPADGRLEITDADGGRTVFELVDGALSVKRPSGAEGVLLDGVASFDISADTLVRLREADPVDDFRTWFDKPAAGDADESLTLESGLPVALGFLMPGAVPDSYDVLPDVEEHAVEGTLLTLDIAMAYVPAIPDDPNQPVTGGFDGSGSGGGCNDPDCDEHGGSGGKGGKGGKGKGGGSGGKGCGKGGGGGGKVEICHVPPGNPGNAHTLSVSENAVQAHLAHGDTLGPCVAPPPPPQNATLAFSLYEARAPDDARPVGDPLAVMELVSAGIPQGSASWVLTPPGAHGSQHAHSPEECQSTTPDGKVVICHVPPGNPSNAHAITVSPNAVAAHLAHGDYYGCCGAHDPTADVYTLQVDADPGLVSLDLSPLGAVIEPGRAYTLVMDLQSAGFLVVAGDEIAGAQHSGVAQSAAVDGPLQPVAMAVPFALQGMQRITQTEEFEPISRLTVALAMEDGAEALGSAGVASQMAVPGAWLGVVPGETEVLEQ